MQGSNCPARTNSERRRRLLSANSWPAVRRDGEGTSRYELSGVVDPGVVEQPHWVVALAVDAYRDSVCRFVGIAEHFLQARLAVRIQMEPVDFRMRNRNDLIVRVRRHQAGSGI